MLTLAAVAVAGCGSSGHHTTTATTAAISNQSSQVKFPQVDGRTLPAVIKGMPQGPELAPTEGTFEPGTDRVAFVLLDRAHAFINGANVALYVSDPDGSHAAGPFPAHSESLETPAKYRSKLVVADMNNSAAPRAIYVANVPMGGGGRKVVLALMQLDGRMVATTTLPIALATAGSGGPPLVGAKAIKITTPTLASVGGAAHASEIDTRIPPATALNEVNFASVVGHKPTVLLFATPEFCQSRTCGPVEDIINELANDPAYKRFAFVHQEIYKNNNPQKGFRPQVADWHLQTEPWLFVIDSHGRIRGRIEGAFGAAEVRMLLDSVH